MERGPFPPPLAMDQGELRRTRRSAKSAKAGRAASVAGLTAKRYTDLENEQPVVQLHRCM
jgi:hypothetical protein